MKADTSNLKCSITLVILNLQNFKRDSYYLCNMSGLITSVEGRKADAVAHLADC